MKITKKNRILVAVIFLILITAAVAGTLSFSNYYNAHVEQAQENIKNFKRKLISRGVAIINVSYYSSSSITLSDEEAFFNLINEYHITKVFFKDAYFAWDNTYLNAEFSFVYENVIYGIRIGWSR